MKKCLPQQNAFKFRILDQILKLRTLRLDKQNNEVNHIILRTCFGDWLDNLHQGVLSTFNFQIISMPYLSEISILLARHSNRKCLNEKLTT